MWNLIQTFDYESEVDFLKALISSLHPKSPIVFCHNDLQEGNILL